MIWLYRLILLIAPPFILIRLWLRSRKNPAYAQRLIERTGKLSNKPKAGGLWVHAVSVGESIAAAPLIEALLLQYPDQSLTVTCTTPTGSEYLQKTFGKRITHSYLPYDYSFFVKRFLRQVQPKVLIILETELWPNLLLACQATDVKTAVVNLRLSDQSFTAYKRLVGLFKPILRGVDVFCAQTQQDAERIIHMGAKPERVNVTGNLKYDGFKPLTKSSSELATWLNADKRLIWCAGSTHEGEDKLMLAAHQALLKDNADTLLVVAPRHPERFDAVTQLSKKMFITERWSHLQASNLATLNSDAQVLILDTIGDLKRFINSADFCFIGGSFVDVGGHNILEACQAGVPVLFGPYMYNFRQIAADVVQTKAGFQIKDLDQLITKAQWLAQSQEGRELAGKQGQKLVAAKGGALEKTLQLCSELI